MIIRSEALKGQNINKMAGTCHIMSRLIRECNRSNWDRNLAYNTQFHIQHYKQNSVHVGLHSCNLTVSMERHSDYYLPPLTILLIKYECQQSNSLISEQQLSMWIQH